MSITRAVLTIAAMVVVLFIVSNWFVGKRYKTIVSGDTPITIGPGQVRYYRLPLNATQVLASDFDGKLLLVEAKP